MFGLLTATSPGYGLDLSDPPHPVPAMDTDNSESDAEIFNLIPKNRKQKIKNNIDENIIGPKGKGCIACSLMMVAVGVVILVSITALEQLAHKEQTFLPAGKIRTPDSDILQRTGMIDHRLPSSVIPELYTLSIKPDADGNKYSGHVKIKVICRNDTKVLVLHSSGHVVTKISLIPVGTANSVGERTTEKKNFQVTGTQNVTNKELMLIEFHKEMKKDKIYEASFEFSGKIGTEPKGLYSTSYKLSNGARRPMILSQFEPSYARRVFPCFDEPRMKAKFEINIIHSHKRALSNQALSKSISLPNGLVNDFFQTTPRISTYSLKIVIGDLSKTDSTLLRRIPVSFFAPPQFAKQMVFISDFAVKSLAFFEKKFKTHNQLSKLDIVFVPGMPASSGAWGLITLSFIKNATAIQQYTTSSAIARQISKMWFDSLVSMDLWSDQWLTESLAIVMATECLRYLRPHWKPDELFYLDETQVALKGGQMAASQSVASLAGNNSRMTYAKGASILKMLISFIGHKRFYFGMSKYLKKYIFKTTTVKDFFDCIAQASKAINMHKVIQCWLDQPGYPVVNIRIDKWKRVHISQKRFSIKRNVNYGSTWYFPLRFKFLNHNKTKRVLLASHKIRMNLPTKFIWLKANIGQKGLYRVNYDSKNWKQLIHQLNSDHLVFDEIDRAGLLDDAFTLTRAGQLSIETAMDATLYLRKETSYLPWSIALDRFQYLVQMMNGKRGSHCLKKYLYGLAKKMISKAESNEDGTVLKRLLIPKLLNFAIIIKDMKSLAKARSIFNHWMRREGRYPIPTSLARWVYRSGIQHGRRKEWNFVSKMLAKNFKGREHRDNLVFGLCGSNSSTRLKSFLDDSLTKQSSKNAKDFLLIFKYLSLRVKAQKFLWKYLVQNWKIIFKRFGHSGQLKTIIECALRTAKDQDIFDKATEFFKTRRTEISSLNVKDVLEKVELNKWFVRRNLERIRNWLKKVMSSRCN